MGDPKVSLIVPCYNYARYLGDCLEGIFAQEGAPEFEVIVVDDASTDDTQDVLARFAGPHLRVSTHVSNQGHVATINEGFALARAPFVARIDPDDRYRPNFLRRTLSVFEKYPEVGMVYGDASIIDQDGHQTQQASDVVHGKRDFKGNEYIALLERNFVCAPTVIARRLAWEKGFPIPVGLSFSDWYLSLMMARHFEFYYVAEVLADYRVHPKNWHTKISCDKTEEVSVRRILDEIFSEPETDDALESAKQKARGRIYGAQYKVFADKYFGLGFADDARRCYLEAVRRRPNLLLDGGVLRRLGASCVGMGAYQRLKTVLKKI